jgi:hypothetical protein
MVNFTEKLEWMTVDVNRGLRIDIRLTIYDIQNLILILQAQNVAFPMNISDFNGRIR